MFIHQTTAESFRYAVCPLRFKVIKRRKMAICDRCTTEISTGEGYCVYSEANIYIAIPGVSMPGTVVGTLLYCEYCANALFTDEIWADARQIAVGFDDPEIDIAKVMQAQRQATNYSIAMRAKLRGLDATQARQESREIAQLWWKDKQAAENQLLAQTESKPPSYKKPETVVGFRERLTPDEWDTLRFIPWKMILFYSASTNGKFTGTYIKSLAQEVVKAKTYRNPLARDVLQSLSTGFEETRQRLNKDTRPLKKFASDVAQILQTKISPEDAEGFKRSISFLCMNVANSIGAQNAFSGQDMGTVLLMFMLEIKVELNELSPANIIETRIVNKSALSPAKKWWEFRK